MEGGRGCATSLVKYKTLKMNDAHHHGRPHTVFVQQLININEVSWWLICVCAGVCVLNCLAWRMCNTFGQVTFICGSVRQWTRWIYIYIYSQWRRTRRSGTLLNLAQTYIYI